MKYPDDFKLFEGKALDSDEINELLQQGLAEKRESIAIGDTMIEVDEGNNITIWQQRAYREG
jgi:hypothetical protein